MLPPTLFSCMKKYFKFSCRLCWFYAISRMKLLFRALIQACCCVCTPPMYIGNTELYVVFDLKRVYTTYEPWFSLYLLFKVIILIIDTSFAPLTNICSRKSQSIFCCLYMYEICVQCQYVMISFSTLKYSAGLFSLYYPCPFGLTQVMCFYKFRG